MSEIPIYEIDRAGLLLPTPTAADTSNGNFFAPNDGAIFLYVTSTAVTDETVTVAANPALDVDGLTVNDLVLDVPYGETVLFGPFRPNSFNQDRIDNIVLVTPSDADLWLTAFRFLASRA
jgi:hypothetical protein